MSKRDPRVDPRPKDRLRIDGVEHRVVRPEDLAEHPQAKVILPWVEKPFVCTMTLEGRGAHVYGLTEWRERAAFVEVLEVASG